MICNNVFVVRESLKGLKRTLIEHRTENKVLIITDSIEYSFLINIHPAFLRKEQIEKAI